MNLLVNIHSLLCNKWHVILAEDSTILSALILSFLLELVFV